MPLVPFHSLPDDARVWVFGADTSLQGASESAMLAAVDRFLADWSAHGQPLTVGREWEEGRFLTVAVDQSASHASGCSIDGLFRTLKGLEPVLGGSMVDKSLVFHRDGEGAIRSVTRAEFTRLASEGAISGATEVFDPTVTHLGEWRARFRSRAEDSWHAGLFPAQST